MKTLLLSAIALISMNAQAAPSTYDREQAFFALLDMGYNVSVEDMGEMFRDNIFILSNSSVCRSLKASLWDSAKDSCLLQVQQDGKVKAFHGDGNDSLYD